VNPYLKEGRKAGTQERRNAQEGRREERKEGSIVRRKGK
jgi:hypothetical protein